jgi:hypothetical protein
LSLDFALLNDLAKRKPRENRPGGENLAFAELTVPFDENKDNTLGAHPKRVGISHGTENSVSLLGCQPARFARALGALLSLPPPDPRFASRAGESSAPATSMVTAWLT